MIKVQGSSVWSPEVVPLLDKHEDSWTIHQFKLKIENRKEWTMRGTFLQLVFLVIGLGHALPLESSFNQTQNVDSHQNPRMSINAFPGSDLPLNSPSQPKAKKITKNWRQRFFQGPQKSRRSADKFQNLQYNPRLTCHVDEECIHVDARLRCKTALAPLVVRKIGD